MRSFFVLVISLLAASCSNQSTDSVCRYHEDGRAKPVVAVASLIDTTSFDCAWSLSEELTSMVVQDLAQTGEIYVNSREDFAFAENPFGNDLSWVKREFHDHEFVVFLELVEHQQAPANVSKKVAKTLPPQEVSTNLNMAIRMRVVDLRGSSPKIVLQEMSKSSYYIPKTLIPTDYNTVVWGNADYQQSPMGIAHSQLIQEVSSRLSDYILLAKSR